MKTTLEDLLKMTVPVQLLGNEVIVTPDFRVSVQSVTPEGVHFIIHPYNHNGQTLDFICSGNTLTKKF